MSIRLLLADDQALVRQALAALLELEYDFEVVA
jgi:two-component system response regulator DesR